MAPQPDDPQPLGRDRPAAGTVRVGRLADGVSVVAVEGEHDLGTHPALTDALERAANQANVVVDLAQCTFIDSSVIGALIKAAQAQQTRGGQLVLVVPAETQMVYRVTRVTGVAAVLPIFESHAAALAGLEGAG